MSEEMSYDMGVFLTILSLLVVIPVISFVILALNYLHAIP